MSIVGDGQREKSKYSRRLFRARQRPVICFVCLFKSFGFKRAFRLDFVRQPALCIFACARSELAQKKCPRVCLTTESPQKNATFQRSNYPTPTACCFLEPTFVLLLLRCIFPTCAALQKQNCCAQLVWFIVYWTAINKHAITEA